MGGPSKGSTTFLTATLHHAASREAALVIRCLSMMSNKTSNNMLNRTMAMDSSLPLFTSPRFLSTSTSYMRKKAARQDRYAREATDALIMRLHSHVHALSLVNSERSALFKLFKSIVQRHDDLKTDYHSLLNCGYKPSLEQMTLVELVDKKMNVILNFMNMASQRSVNISRLIMSMEIPRMSLLRRLPKFQSCLEEGFCFPESKNALNINQFTNNFVPRNEEKELLISNIKTETDTTKDDPASKDGDIINGSWPYQEEEYQSDKSWLIEHEEEVITDCNCQLIDTKNKIDGVILDSTVGQFEDDTVEYLPNAWNEISEVVVARPFTWRAACACYGNDELYDRSYPDMQKGDAVQHTAQPKPNPVNAKPHKDVVGSKRHEARTVAQAAALEPVRWSTAIGIVVRPWRTAEMGGGSEDSYTIQPLSSTAPLRAQPLALLPVVHVVSTQLYARRCNNDEWILYELYE
ncbi:hypothetical protein RB195_004876 [Necator americanus]|uniref:Uncharacterized protein n=1 Tax=Necator americanus TaxID=51031 RepID=A0ABR1BN67_NECAM